MTDIQKLMRRIPKRFRNTVVTIITATDAAAASRAYKTGYDAAKLDLKHSKEQFRVDLSISMQKLADSNAQLSTCLVRAIEKLV